MPQPQITTVRRLVLAVAALNLAYCIIELVMAARLGSVSLFADAADFFEDTAINLLVFFALTWSVAARRRAGATLAFLILIPAAAALITAISKIINPAAPNPGELTATAIGALVVNVICALLLVRLKDGGDDADSASLTKGAWLAARNDALANVLIIAAGVATFFYSTGWFDIIVGLIIAAINYTAFREVWEAATHEGDPMELLDDDD